MNKKEIEKMVEKHGNAFSAYIELNGEEDATEEDFEEKYSGHFDSDEKFARDMAENTCDMMIKDNQWPMYCIDWEWAARELMMDYSVENGFYFREL